MWSNRTDIWHLSIKKHLNILKSFVDSDREKNSALNESIFVEFKLGFDELEGQTLVFRSFKKRYRCLLLSYKFFKKMRYLEWEHRVLSNCKNFSRTTTKDFFQPMTETPRHQKRVVIKCKINLWKIISDRYWFLG